MLSQHPYSKSLPAEIPGEDFRLKPVRLRIRTRSSRRRRGLGLHVAGGGWRGRRAYGVRGLLLGLFRAGGRIYHGGVVLSFLLSRRSWSNGFGFLLARSEKRDAGQNADQFFHSCGLVAHLGTKPESEQSEFPALLKLIFRRPSAFRRPA